MREGILVFGNHAIGKWNIAELGSETLTLAQPVEDESFKCSGEFGIVVLRVKKHPGISNDWIGIRRGRIGKPGSQIRGKLDACKSFLAALQTRRNEIPTPIFEHGHRQLI